jgi:hypothetical protein
VSAGPNGLQIDVKVKGLRPAASLGPAYLTYVLWAARPNGKFDNLGELVVNGSTGTLMVTANSEDFAMMITAEPYFAVTEPSNAVVIKNTVPQGVLRYKLAPALLPLLRDRDTPLDLVQARNAVRIARRLGAERQAPVALEKAVKLLSQAEQHYRKDDKWRTVLTAREATEAAEAARLLAAQALPE